MADQRVTIALQVQLAGLSKVQDLNSALKILKGVADRFARGQQDAVKAATNGIVNSARNIQKELDSLAGKGAAYRQRIGDRESQVMRSRWAQQVTAAKQAQDATNRVREQGERAYNQRSVREAAAAAGYRARDVARIEGQTTKRLRAEGAQRFTDMLNASKARQKEQLASTKMVEQEERASLQRQGREAAAAMRGRAADAKRAASLQIAELRRVAREQERINAMMKTFSGRIRIWEALTGAITRAGYHLQSFGQDFEMVGRRMLDALGGIMKGFGDFEFMVNRTAGVMAIAFDNRVLTNSLGEQGTLLDHLKEGILDASEAAVLFPAQDMAKAMYFWSSTTGQTIESTNDLKIALDGVVPIMKAAAMTETGFETAIKGVYSILAQYRLGLGATSDVTAILYDVTQRTAAEFPDLVNSFKMVGPVANEMGVKFLEVANYLGTLADAGIRGTMAGRALRQFFIQTVRPSGPAKDVMESLFGTDYQSIITDVSGRFIGMTAFIDKLAGRLKNLTTVQRAHTIASITTANELPVLMALVSRAINDLDDASSKTGSTVEDAQRRFTQAWDVLAGSWNGVVASFQRGLERIQMYVGTALSETLGPIIRDFGENLAQVADWVRENEAIVGLAGKIAAFSAVALIAVGIVSQFAGALMVAGQAIGGMLFAFGPLVARFTIFGGIVAGVVSAVIKNWDWLVEQFDAARQSIEDGLRSAGVSAEDAASIFESIRDVFVGVGEFIVKTFGNMVRVFGEFAGAVLSNRAVVGVLTELAKAIALVFAIRSAAGLLGITAALGALVRIGKTAAQTILGIRAAVIVTANTSGRLSGLVAGLRAVWAAAGGPITAIAAIGAALIALSPIGQGIFNGLSDMLTDWGAKVDETAAKFGESAEHIKATVRELVSGQVAADEKWNAKVFAMEGVYGAAKIDLLRESRNFDQVVNEEIARMEERARQLAAAFNPEFTTEDYGSMLSDFMLRGRMEKGQAEHVIAAYQVNFGAQLAAGTPVSRAQAEEFIGRMQRTIESAADRAGGSAAQIDWKKVQRRVFDPDAISAATDVAAREANDAIAESTMAALDAMLKLPLDTPQKQIQAAELVARLIDFKEMGTISSDIADRVGQYVSDIPSAIQAALDANMNEAQMRADARATAKSAAQAVMTGILDGFKTLKNWPEKAKEIMEEAPSLRELAKTAIGQLTSADFTALITSSNEAWNAGAQLWASDVFDTVLANFHAEETVGRHHLLNMMIDFLGNSIPQGLPQETQTLIATMLAEMYTALGKPIPAWVSAELGTEFGGAIATGAEEGAAAGKTAADAALSAAFPPGKGGDIVTAYMTQASGKRKIAASEILPAMPSATEVAVAVQPVVESVKTTISGGLGVVATSMAPLGQNIVAELVAGLGAGPVIPAAHAIVVAVLTELGTLWTSVGPLATSIVLAFAAAIKGSTGSAQKSAASVASAVIKAFLGYVGWATIAGRNLTNALAGGIRDSAGAAQRAAGSVASSAVRAFTGYSGWASIAGQNLGNSFAGGIRSTSRNVANAAASLASASASYLRIMSPAEKGPLSTLMQWGPNLGNTIAEGILATTSNVAYSANRLAEAAYAPFAAEMHAGVSMDSSVERRAVIELQVTSPDGSIRSTDKQAIGQAVGSSDIFTELVHLVTVG